MLLHGWRGGLWGRKQRPGAAGRSAPPSAPQPLAAAEAAVTLPRPLPHLGHIQVGAHKHHLALELLGLEVGHVLLHHLSSSSWGKGQRGGVDRRRGVRPAGLPPGGPTLHLGMHKRAAGCPGGRGCPAGPEASGARLGAAPGLRPLLHCCGRRSTTRSLPRCRPGHCRAPPHCPLRRTLVLRFLGASRSDPALEGRPWPAPDAPFVAMAEAPPGHRRRRRRSEREREYILFKPLPPGAATSAP